MREIDAHFDAYEHLKELPRENEALFLLRRAASLVKPIMRKRGWKVRTLAEFLPPDPRLQGLNVNRTEKIYVRLRYTPDPKQFLAMEMIVDTLLHELSHIVWGPHDHNFQRLWDELRDEHQTLLLKGFTGEGFLSEGHKLGGKRMPLDEMRRQARRAAEKRRAALSTSKGSGQKLGGSSVPRGADMRAVIANAVDKRNKITTDGCASGSKEVVKAAEEQSKRNGFRTKAEEDDANDLAIMNALIELMEEEETRKLNEMYGTPSEDGGLTWTPENGLQLGEPVATSAPSTPPPPPVSYSQPPSRSHSHSDSHHQRPQAPATRPNRPVSRLVTEADARKQQKRSASGSSVSTSSSTQAPSTHASQPASFNDPYASSTQQKLQSSMWTCPICTLENPLNYLCCDACGIERPVYVSEAIAAAASSSPGARQSQNSMGWNCGRCGSFMEHQWWTCSACGLMKGAS